MADTKLTGLTQIPSIAFDDYFYVVDKSDTTQSANGSSRYGLFSQLQTLMGIAAFNDGRLSTESGVYVSTSDRTSQGTLYFVGTAIMLKYGSNYVPIPINNDTLSVSGSSGQIKDVWASTSDGSSLTLSFSNAWTNSTTRSDAIARTKFWHKSGDETKRYVGTICLSGTNVTEDSEASRYVFCVDNPRLRSLRAHYSAASWSYGTATWRRTAGLSATPGTNQVRLVLGLAESAVSARLHSVIFGSTSGWSSSAISLDWSSGAPNSYAYGGWYLASASAYDGNPGIGSHTLDWIEYADVSTTFYGIAGASQVKSGLYGSVMA